jgi:hypothetical protein
MGNANTGKAFSDPEEARRARHREWSECLRQLVERNRNEACNIAVLAAKAGYQSKSILQRQLDPEHKDSVAIADVDVMPVGVALGAAEKLASRHGYALVKLPEELTVTGALLAIAKIQKESGEAIVEAVTALADGRLDRAEAAKLLRELDELVAAVLPLRTWCQRALADGVFTVIEGGAS